MQEHVSCATHPLIQHHLANLRDQSTPPAEFRRLIQRLSVLLAYEATQDLPLTTVSVQTPLTMTQGAVLRQRIGLVPILRAGLGMVDGILNLIPDAEVWHLGVYRDEATAQPVQYYSKLPASQPVDLALVVDPMLATGGSAVAALQILKKWNVPRLKLLAIIAAQDGINHVRDQLPEVDIHVCAIDPELNDHKYIVPGLGDAGDRIFHTIQR
ncbi:MAG: uracil phosphoribosyltransferase [Pirellulales bacterium]|nr:uracil phosphoribosyltransferase [Pirellulales bacterium]